MRSISLLQAFGNIVLSFSHQPMGDLNNGNSWLQDGVIWGKSGPCMLFSYSPKHWNNPDKEHKRSQPKSWNDTGYKAHLQNNQAN